jgi:hypothetical protein
MNQDDGDKPGLLDKLKNKWKTESRWKKAMWMALALLAIWFIYEFKKNWDKERAKRDK